MRTLVIEVEGWEGPPETWTDEPYPAVSVFWELCRVRPELERARCLQSHSSPLHAARIHLMGESSKGPGRVILCAPLPRVEDEDGNTFRDESSLSALLLLQP